MNELMGERKIFFCHWNNFPYQRHCNASEINKAAITQSRTVCTKIFFLIGLGFISSLVACRMWQRVVFVLLLLKSCDSAKIDYEFEELRLHCVFDQLNDKWVTFQPSYQCHRRPSLPVMAATSKIWWSALVTPKLWRFPVRINQVTRIQTSTHSSHSILSRRTCRKRSALCSRTWKPFWWQKRACGWLSFVTSKTWKSCSVCICRKIRSRRSRFARSGMLTTSKSSTWAETESSSYQKTSSRTFTTCISSSPTTTTSRTSKPDCFVATRTCEKSRCTRTTSRSSKSTSWRLKTSSWWTCGSTRAWTWALAAARGPHCVSSMCKCRKVAPVKSPTRTNCMFKQSKIKIAVAVVKDAKRVE